LQVAEEHDVVSAAQFDGMSPEERAEAVRRSLIHTWDDLEPSFRARVEARARTLAQRSEQDA